MSATAIVIWSVLGLVFIYDAFALNKGYEKTISWTLFSASRRWTVIPFLFGMLAGHLWFSVTGPDGRTIPMPPETKPCESPTEQSK